MRKLFLAATSILFVLSLMACSSSTGGDGNGGGGGGGGGGGQEFASGDLGNGASFTHVFNNVGTFDYFCRYHVAVGMSGTIVVAAESSPMYVPIKLSYNITGNTLPDYGIVEGDTLVWTNMASFTHTVESNN